MTATQKQVLFENPARAIGDAPKEAEIPHIGNCMKADPAYGEGVAGALGLAIGDMRFEEVGSEDRLEAVRTLR